MLQTIDPSFIEITENSEEEEREKLKTKWTKLEAIVSSTSKSRAISKRCCRTF